MEWKSLLLGSEEWSFLWEAGLRTFVMFLVILMYLRLLGKRGVKQLSVFELGVIIGLGSAAGDPMFYKDVGLLPGILVFSIVFGLYRLITFLINRSNKLEKFVEGEATCILKKGQILIENFESEPIARDELYSQLRLHSVSHLGQIDEAIIETNGEVSVFYFPEEQVRFGLPILPSLCTNKFDKIPEQGHYSCSYCGYTTEFTQGSSVNCPCCKKQEWLKAINHKRIQ